MKNILTSIHDWNIDHRVWSAREKIRPNLIKYGYLKITNGKHDRHFMRLYIIKLFT